MDPVVNKLTTTLPDSSTPESGGQPGKAEASKFDKVKSQLADSNSSDDASPGVSTKPPQSAASTSPNVDRVQQGSTAPPDQVRQNLAAGQYHINRLKERIESSPGLDSMRGLQSRLSSIEHQYTALDKAAKVMPPNASPQQWMQLQQQVYSMNENIGVLSKMVGQAASGVKSILQTQV